MTQFAPPTPPRTASLIAPASAYETDSQLVVNEGRDRWLFLCRSLKAASLPGESYLYRYVSISKNGRYIVAPYYPDGERFPYGSFWKFSRPALKTSYPVIAIRAHSGIGWHWDTMFYRIWKGRLQIMGHSPAINSNGPVNWRGRTDRWLFDNFNRYSFREEKPYLPELLLYRIAPRTGKMILLRRWPSPHRSILRDTVRLNSW